MLCAPQPASSERSSCLGEHVASLLRADWRIAPGRTGRAEVPGGGRRHGDRDGPGGRVRPGGLQPRSLRVLHAVDRRAALHRQRPHHPPVLLAQGIRSDHPRGGWAAAAAIYRCFYNGCDVEEQKTCPEIRLKAQLRDGEKAPSLQHQAASRALSKQQQCQAGCSLSHIPSSKDTDLCSLQRTD